MKKQIILFLFILVMQLSVFSADNSVSEWQKVAENNYVNFEGVMGTSDRYGYSFLLKSYNKGQYEPVNNRKIAYTISQYTIDCDKYSYKIGMMDSYGSEDNYITGDYNKYAQFQPIISDTAVWNVANKLCKFRN